VYALKEIKQALNIYKICSTFLDTEIISLFYPDDVIILATNDNPNFGSSLGCRGRWQKKIAHLAEFEQMASCKQWDVLELTAPHN
jgi:hypothetical protein